MICRLYKLGTFTAPGRGSLIKHTVEWDYGKMQDPVVLELLYQEPKVRISPPLLYEFYKPADLFIHLHSLKTQHKDPV